MYSVPQDRKPYDHEIAKALEDLQAAHDILTRAGFNIKVSGDEHQPIEIPVSQEIFSKLNSNKLEVQSSGDTGLFRVYKSSGPNFKFFTVAPKLTSSQAEGERQAA